MNAFDPQLLACDAARPLASRVADKLGVPLVPTRETWFACGEGKTEILESIRGTDVYVFQAPAAPGDDRTLYDRVMMLLHTVEAACLADAQRITAVTPYFPGARQDKRKGHIREGISAGLVARCLQAAGADRVVALDIHNEAIGGMFHPARCRLENVALYTQLAPWLKAQGLAAPVIAAPDVGGLERARFYAQALRGNLVMLSKVRDYDQPNRVVEATLIGEVKGRDVLLIDDIVDTAGTACAAVEELKRGGARHVTLACAHPLLSGPAKPRLSALHDTAEREGWRFRVVGTSSIEHVDPPPWYVEFDIAEILAGVIEHLHRDAVRGKTS